MTITVVLFSIIVFPLLAGYLRGYNQPDPTNDPKYYSMLDV